MTNQNNKFPSHIFRAYDIRGEVSLLTAPLVKAIGYALVAQYQAAGQTQLAIGYDARLTSPAYAEIIRQVCQEKGLQATIIGCCATPVLYFIARSFDGNGIMLTASHNPKTDNGLKWIMQGEPPCPDMIQQVASTAKAVFNPVEKISIAPCTHEVLLHYCLQYQQALLDDIQLKRRFKVALDGLNGSAGQCAALVLQKLDCELIPIRCDADGHFPAHAPDPSQKKHLLELRKTVLEQHADLGIALDGDGDRVVLIDEHANIISADRLLSLFAEMCLTTHPAHEVVFDVKCSTMVRNTVRNLGGQPTMIRTGSSFLRRHMSRSNGKAVFGGEYAGHYVFNDGRGFGYDDGLYAALRVLEYLSQQPDLTLSELLQAYPERSCTEDIYISTHNEQPIAVLQDIESKSDAFKAQLSKIDGVRLDFTDGFGIIRASNTGEYFTVRFDADNPLRLNAIRDTFVSMLRDRYPKIAQDILDA